MVSANVADTVLLEIAGDVGIVARQEDPDLIVLACFDEGADLKLAAWTEELSGLCSVNENYGVAFNSAEIEEEPFSAPCGRDFQALLIPETVDVLAIDLVPVRPF